MSLTLAAIIFAILATFAVGMVAAWYRLRDEDALQYEEMLRFYKTHEGMPDGAFFAMAEDLEEWDTADWIWFMSKYYKEQ